MISKLRSSARTRILSWVLAPVLMMLMTLLSSAWFVLNQELLDRVDRQLLREAAELELLARSAIDSDTGVLYESARDLLRVYVQRTAPSENETVFVMVDGEVVARTADEVDFRLDQDRDFIARLLQLAEPTVGNYDSDEGAVRFLALPVNGLEDSGLLLAAFFIDEEAEGINQAMTTFLYLALISFLATGVVGWFVAGRVLKPIGDIRDTAHLISNTDLTGRIPIHQNARGEIKELALEFNSMLDRINEAFENQKQFIDDAGHELRTPLTIIRGHLDLMQSQPDQSQASKEIVVDEIGRMSRLVQDLQTLTKSNQPDFIKLKSVELAGLNDELLVKASALAERNWRLREVSPENVLLDKQRITQAVLQLADNAAKNTGVGDAIEIGAIATKDRIEFFVADSGPGIPLQDREQILRRFARGAAIATDSPGSGLGLAVVEAIAQGHGGSIEISDSALGGARVAIVMPRVGI